MIVCLRTVVVPPELVCEPAEPGGETVVITIWPSHEVFDAWIATPYRDALTTSEVHQAVSYRPITRYEVTGGYLDLAGLASHDLASQPEPAAEEPS